jgi:hypothetical protein
MALASLDVEVGFVDRVADVFAVGFSGFMDFTYQHLYRPKTIPTIGSAYVYKSINRFNIFRTVQLHIILVGNQLDAQLIL